MTERRDPDNADTRRLFDEIGKIHSKMSDLNTSFMVYAARNDGRLTGVEKTVDGHVKNFQDIEKMKNRGFLYALLAMAVSGTFGGGVAHLAEKLVK